MTEQQTVRLVVPEEFNRNSHTVSSLMAAEQSGLWLLERMRRQVGLETYADTKLLDVGCGVRFSQAILNTGFSIRRYVGVDCLAPMIDFLRHSVSDPRFAYHLWDVGHPLYNPAGQPLTQDSQLPLEEREFDLICMVSLLTHQTPSATEAILRIVRRHLGAHGRLFFTCFLDPNLSSFEDRSPQQNGGKCVYNPGFLASIVERSGWRTLAAAPAEAPLIGDSFVCAPG